MKLDFKKTISKIKNTNKNKITTFEPKQYEDITLIADHLKKGSSVVMNLSKMPEHKFHRCVDFIAGVLYTIDGNIEKLGDQSGKMYLLTPHSVVVTPEYRKTIMNLNLDKI